MANNMNFTPEQINLMLQMVGKKLGKDPEQLRYMIEKGDMNSLAGSVKGPMGEQLGSVLGDPKQMQDMMNSADLSKLLNQIKK